MGLILLKKLSILFLILASLLSACIAGGQSKFFNELAKEADTMNEKPSRHDEEDSIHERLLRVNTKDYGRYDPAPALVKPPFKLIPN
ncbi:protein CASPARIAN STRIP INTEGRITY FACTOR 1-like isoform X2 [Juglans microcarpa x Juglans regia]|uniref:protein CASPARIAN STRIP INTEGRITY FACTOR 1-like isoform X2 n=1 Tax=Juglans microcarpa x Juglans regia TaxID=2249226 RepID=UPI0008DD7881|nr:protein CASPARIAN STRIP INTEGRITY FACTOR 1-like isoform X2 [Juglans microcarpa x Juglans regia]